MDDRLLDAVCESLKPSLYAEDTYIVREGDPVDEMLFIIRGHLDSVTTGGGRTGFFNRGALKQGDFCGEELLTWALDPKSGANLPSSTKTVRALSEVEAFALRAEDLKLVATQFRRLHSKQFQHTFRYYSQHWQTWAIGFIQAAWRRHYKWKNDEFHRREELKLRTAMTTNSGAASSSLGVTIYVSRFGTNALHGVQRLRNTKLPEDDLRKIAFYCVPSVEKKVVNAANNLRSFYSTEDIASLPSDMEDTRELKSEDVVRVLCAYGLNAEKSEPSIRDEIKQSVVRLLKEFVDVSVSSVNDG